MTTMCYHPWVGLDISPQGEFRPCCKYIPSLGKTLKKYSTSSELAQLRQNFLDGVRSPGCSRCWQDEDAGLPSKRTLDNQYIFNNSIPDLNTLKVLSLPFGNTCNLACRTCNSLASSRWSQEERKLKEYFPEIVIYKHQKFYKDDEFIDNIKNISSQVIDVTFPGGEPFITGIPQQLDFLDFLIRQNSKDITLNYITNTTVFPDKEYWIRWKKFKKVNLLLSVDSIGDKFEYLRWPTNWDNCYNNIKAYQDKQSSVPNLQLSISHTISIFNVLYLPEFVIWCIKEKLPQPYFGMVLYPEWYNINTLPNKIKTRVKQKLTMDKFSSIIKFMESHSTTTDDISKTVSHITVLDRERNQDFSVVFPELKDYLQ